MSIMRTIKLLAALAATASASGGWVTTFTPGPASAPGSCGIGSSDSENVAAIGAPLFDSAGVVNHNNNPFCGRMVRATSPAGATVDVKVVDRCVACGQGDLDLSMAAFSALTGQNTGKIDGITWDFI